MVLQVLAHARGVDPHRDAVSGEVCRGADAAQHEQLRGVDRPAAQDHLAPRPHVPREAREVDVHPGRPRLEAFACVGVGEGDPPHEGVGEHSQVAPPRRGAQVRVGRRCPGAAVLRHHRLGESLPRGQVGGGNRMPELARRGEERRRVGARVALVLDGLRAGDALCGVGRVLGAFHAREVRRQRLPRPRVAGDRRPFVVVGGEPAHPHHGVQRRRSAERPAPGPVDGASLQFALRDGVVVPVVAAAEQLRERRRDVKLQRPVHRPGLQQDHTHGGILAQPRRERGSRGPRADDDVVGLERRRASAPAAGAIRHRTPSRA